MDKSGVYRLRRGRASFKRALFPGGPILPMPLSDGRSAPTFRSRQQSCVEVQPRRSGLNETDVGARETSETVPTSALCHPVTRLHKVIACRLLTSPDRPQGPKTCTRTSSTSQNQQEHPNPTKET